MDSIAWFFFKLLIYEHVEDVQTGMAFRLPGGYKWNIYIEVSFCLFFPFDRD